MVVAVLCAVAGMLAAGCDTSVSHPQIDAIACWGAPSRCVHGSAAAAGVDTTAANGAIGTGLPGADPSAAASGGAFPGAMQASATGDANAASAGAAPVGTPTTTPASGGNDTGTGQTGTGSSGTDTAAAAAGAGVTTGSTPADDMGAAGAAGGDAIGLQCPNEACPALPEPPPEAAAYGFEITQCCASDGECGTSLNGADCVATPDSDPQCPQIEIMGFMAPACCTSDGKCGLDGSAVGMPCMSIEDVSALAAGLFELPPPQACTPAG